MKWSTPIAIEEKKGYLQHGSPMLLLGSCFADNVGEYLHKAKFDIEINPFGTLYNPESIANALERLMSGERYRADELQQSGGLWYSYHHHVNSQVLQPKQLCRTSTTAMNEPRPC
ncbi:MAG: GSCFA domain-containing protein [Bacteroidaceae bacterium]|nr:GSCFA domain-containing protein [Bacteroidaceae bacterium]